MSESEGEGEPPPVLGFDGATPMDHSMLSCDLFSNASQQVKEKTVSAVNSVQNFDKDVSLNSHIEHRNDNNAYSDRDTGPFVVMIEASEKINKNIGKISQLKIAKELLDNNVTDIVKLKIKGKNRIAIEFSNFLAANRFSSHKGLKDKGYNIYIPYNMVSCKGIIRHVDLDYDIEVLKKSIISPRRIINARRLNRKKINMDGAEYVPTGTVLLTFEGINLPRSVEIWRLPFSVVPYVPPVTQCHACHRYGHTKTLCKSRPKCYMCAEEPHDESCNRKCFHCGSGDHTSFFSQCPEHQRQVNIRHLMAFNNLSYYDAAQLCPVTYKLIHSETLRSDHSQQHPADFPSLNKLPSQQSSDITVSQRRLVATEDNRIRSKRTYAQVINTDKITKRRNTSVGYNKDTHNACLDSPNGREFRGSTPHATQSSAVLGKSTTYSPVSATSNSQILQNPNQFYKHFLLLPNNIQNEIRDSILKHFRMEPVGSSDT